MPVDLPLTTRFTLGTAITFEQRDFLREHGFLHDGRLWHRVARSEHVGAASLRRSMYLPYLTGPHEPKSEDSPTPAYHRVAEWVRGRGSRRRHDGMVAGCAR